jgi:hypothetical protein
LNDAGSPLPIGFAQMVMVRRARDPPSEFPHRRRWLLSQAMAMKEPPGLLFSAMTINSPARARIPSTCNRQSLMDSYSESRVIEVRLRAFILRHRQSQFEPRLTHEAEKEK